MRHTHLIASFALVAATVLSGCRADEQAAQNDKSSSSTQTAASHTNNLTVPSGTSIGVTLATSITSETATVGSSWSGSTTNAAVVDGRDIIPAGSSVSGTVTSVKPARKGDRAMLDLGMNSITVGSHSYHVRGSMESVIAGSPRARNLGAIGAATVVGAVAGHAIGGNDKGTIIGGLIGGGAATGVVSQTKGYQVVLKPGTALTFTTNEAIAVRI